MNLLHIVDLGNGQIEVGWRRDNELPRHFSPIPFEEPLSAEDRAELRWYLEQYPPVPLWRRGGSCATGGAQDGGMG